MDLFTLIGRLPLSDVDRTRLQSLEWQYVDSMDDTVDGLTCRENLASIVAELKTLRARYASTDTTIDRRLARIQAHVDTGPRR